MSFHLWQLISVSSISHAVLTAPLECSTCPNQRSLLSLKMRSRTSSSNFANSLIDLAFNFILCELCLNKIEVFLSYEVAPGSDLMPCIKIDKPLVV